MSLANIFISGGIMGAVIAAIIAGVLGVVGTVIAGSMNSQSQKTANETNIELQQQANEWNESMMREAWARDDTQVQRRVADLQAAGLHPSLAAGGGQASSPIHVGATRVESERWGDMFKGAMDSAGMAAQNAMNIAHTKAQNNLLKQQAHQSQAQTANIMADTKYKYEELEHLKLQHKALSHSTRIKLLQEDRDQAEHTFEMIARQHDFDIYKELNLPRGTNLSIISTIEQVLGTFENLTGHVDRVIDAIRGIGNSEWVQGIQQSLNRFLGLDYSPSNIEHREQVLLENLLELNSQQYRNQSLNEPWRNEDGSLNRRNPQNQVF